MKISILTLFPEMFKGPFDYSILKHALEKKVVALEFVNIRDFGLGRHKIVDDKPYGGGVGMVMRVDVVDRAISNIKSLASQRSGQISNIKYRERVILLDPKGMMFTQKKAREFSKLDHLILICGHYEGFDERIRKFVDEEISIGDYILTGGELPSMVVVDAVVRLIKGVLKKKEATELESFSQKNLLEYPQYTRPEVFENLRVPNILLSGNHSKISKWRVRQALQQTLKRRPDLKKRPKD